MVGDGSPTAASPDRRLLRPNVTGDDRTEGDARLPAQVLHVKHRVQCAAWHKRGLSTGSEDVCEDRGDPVGRGAPMLEFSFMNLSGTGG